MVERRTVNAEVAGSSPALEAILMTKYVPMFQGYGDRDSKSRWVGSIPTVRADNGSKALVGEAIDS